ncbi:MAG TPA: hypothetical protein VFP65_15130, partial [Anaeromyxobacteraceae bacterium]|nr:hypothetical protein [Anaeromyxobacteraceae bacterium]
LHHPAAEPLARARATLRGAAAVRRGPRTPPVWLHRLEQLDGALGDLADVAGGAGRAPRGALTRAAPV